MTDAEFDGTLDEAARLLSASAFPVIAGLATDLAGVGRGVSACREARRRGRPCRGRMRACATRRCCTIRADAGQPRRGAPARRHVSARRRRPARGLAGPRRLPLRAGSHAFLGRPAAAADPGAVEPRDRCPPSRRHRVRDPLRRRRSFRRCSRRCAPASTRRPLADGFDRTEIDRLAGLMMTARFGVAVWSPAELDALTIEMLVGLIKDLNAETRWSGISVAADASVIGAATAAGLMTGVSAAHRLCGGAGRSTIRGASTRGAWWNPAKPMPSSGFRPSASRRRPGSTPFRASSSSDYAHAPAAKRVAHSRSAGRASITTPSSTTIAPARSSQVRALGATANGHRRRRARPASPTRLPAP